MNGNRAILIVESAGSPPLPSATALLIATAGTRMVLTSSPDQALEILKSNKIDQFIALVTNSANFPLLEFARQTQLGIKTVLVTAATIYSYSKELKGKDDELIDHVVAQTSDEWTNKDLRITLQKIIQNDFFGIEKYMNGTYSKQTHAITASKDRETCNQAVQKWVEECGFGKNIGRLAFGITEELMMNAIYDAPVAGGRAHYEAMERSTQRMLMPDEYSHLNYGSDGKTLAISIEDPFGAFKREKWWEYVRKILRRDDPEGLIDTKKGGAGLGLFKMLYSSHGVVCNVDPGVRTEVIVLIDLVQPVRDFSGMPRSMHYFCK